MDNFKSNNLGNQNLNEPFPSDRDLDKPKPFDDTTQPSVSHSPLDLGISGTAQAPKIEVPKPIAKTPAKEIASADRITSVKTFFIKLHPGAIEFLDEQISKWLKENPSIKIKQISTTTGEVQAKKTEPNIIITVWY